MSKVISDTTSISEIIPGVHAYETVFWGKGLNLYLINGERALLFDSGAAGMPTDIILPTLDHLDRELSFLVNAHSHIDHVGGNAEIQDRFKQVVILSHVNEIGPILQVKIALHSDGYVEPIISDLIEIGLDILNPIQSTSMDPAKIKKQYGQKLTLWGTVDNQYIMPFGTPDDVEEEVRLRIRTCARGGGLILSPTHRIQPQTSAESMVRFYESVKKHGKYPISV